MALPSSQDLRIQILNILNDQQVHGLAELKDTVARKFEVSNEDKKKLEKNKRPIFETRIVNTLSLLRQDGHIINQNRANFKITKSGITKLKNL